MAQAVKNLTEMKKTQDLSLGLEDSLEKGMATHSSIPAWRIPQTEELEGYSPWGRKDSGMTEPLTLSLYDRPVALLGIYPKELKANLKLPCTLQTFM